MTTSSMGRKMELNQPSRGFSRNLLNWIDPMFMVSSSFSVRVRTVVFRSELTKKR